MSAKRSQVPATTLLLNLKNKSPRAILITPGLGAVLQQFKRYDFFALNARL
jgi:hypothetical protein